MAGSALPSAAHMRWSLEEDGYAATRMLALSGPGLVAEPNMQPATSAPPGMTMSVRWRTRVVTPASRRHGAYARAALTLVSRFRSSQVFAATLMRTSEPKGH